MKQNVEFVEAETRRLFRRVRDMRVVLKTHHNQLRYMLPLDFHETFDRLVDFLEHLELKGGVEEIMAIPRAATIMCYDETGHVPKGLIDAISAKMRPLILQELVGLKSQVAKLRDESISHTQFTDVFQAEGRKLTTGPGVEMEKERELTRRAMIAVVKDVITEERHELHLEEERKKRSSTVGHLLQMEDIMTRSRAGSHSMLPIGASSSSPSSSNLAAIATTVESVAGKAYVDEKMQALVEQLENLRMKYESTKDAAGTDISKINSKLEMLESANQMLIERDAEQKDQRKKDVEALKIMQKRVANVSIDNVRNNPALLMFLFYFTY